MKHHNQIYYMSFLRLIRITFGCGVILVLVASIFWSAAVTAPSFLPAFLQNKGRTGSISASPNPITVCDGTGQGVTKLTWTSTGTTTVEVHVGSPNGTFLARTGPSGTVTTGKWVTNGTVFFLQDVSGGLPLTSANTLATVTVSVISSSCAPTPTPTPTPAVYEGWHDGADCTRIFGWAADRNRLNTSISVDIYDGAALLTTVVANVSRPDVGAYLGDNGLHGFDISTPASVKNGQPHSITVKFAGTSQSLSGTPRSITCGCTVPIASPPSSLPPDNVWVEDQTPAGAVLTGTWVWDTTQKASGLQSHTEPAVSGTHQHFFEGATQPLSIGVGDRLVSYVLINPCNPPQEIMLQWFESNSGWDHRAFWGADLIPWGVAGTASRFSMGTLPQAGVWVRLEVPAAAVGLENRTISGMAFTLYDGQAWFDRAGKTSSASGDLVGHWKFDEGFGVSTADSSGNNNNGTLQNGSAWTTGKINTGLSFDGVDDYVQVGPGSRLSMTNALTIAAWVFPTVTGNGIIVNKEGEYEIAVAGTVQWALANTNPNWTWINTGYAPLLNQWTHIALVYDGTSAKTYANGSLVHTLSASGPIFQTTNDFRIGGRQCCAQFFQGKLDEVRVYNRALSATEVQGLANTSTGSRAPHNATQTPWPVPSSSNIEVEDFDDWNPPKGEGHTYHDDSVGNDWGLYRPGEDVDIPASSDVGGGYEIGNAHGGEWLEYTVNVTSSPCDIQVRVASGGPGGRFHIEFDRVDKTGPIQVPDTGSWGTWTTLTAQNVSLPLGQHIMRLALDQNGTQQFPAVADFNYIRIVTSGGLPNQPPTVSITGTNPVPPFSAPATITVNATASDPDPGDSIASVQFKKDGVNQGPPDTVAPYTVTLNSLPSGTYVMTAVATDSRGATTTSAPFSITVNSTTSQNFLLALADPVNRTGTPGEDLFSGNYNWNLPLLELAGRAGLDLELSLSYNSLVWTKSGSSIKFDADNGFPAAGFHLGLPVIQPRGIGNGVTPAYLLITSSGARVELRQTIAGIFESMNSSNLQLLESSMTLLTPNGSILTYQQVANGNFVCVGVKDRNGNFITVSYSGNRINTITDTLARVITFNYQSGFLASITQTWNGVTHTWAQFNYQLVSIVPNFAGLTVIAPTSITALKEVRFPDGSSYSFDYTPLGQISTFRHLAPDAHTLATTTYTTDNSTVDCPRLTGRQEFVEGWNNGSAASTSFQVDPFVTGIGTAVLPDGMRIEETASTSGFNRGLPIQSKVISGGVAKKTTTMTWTQNDTSLSYPANPRVIDTSTTDDAGNLRRTSFAYTSFNLVSDVLEYAAGGTTVLRHKQTDYVMDAAYIDRRIIGLPREQRLYDGSGTANLISKISYNYDWGWPFLQNQGTPLQHDSTNFSDAFVVGRGNVSAVNRFDVITGQSTQVQLIGYNTTGSPIFIRDAIRNVQTISYSDSFSAGTPPGLTLAYPTTILDGENFTTTATYHYDLGVTTKTHDPKGAEMIMEYNDPAGRLTRQTYFDSLNQISGTYTRLEYAANGTEGRAYTLLDPGVETFSAVVTDGVGRTIGTVKNLPGSVGGYSAQRFTYDVLGRLRQQSNPAEISYTLGQNIATWTPTGDDAGAWKFSTQDYDWKGRPTTTYNTDGTIRSATYGGCGCAGSEVVTLTDEVGRRRINTSDIVGRLITIQELRDDGTIYRTTRNTYNARDQIVSSVLQRGNDGPGQTTTTTYDGHGRLKTRRLPIQTSATSYDYNADDTIRMVTDPRGATATYTYNDRRLVTGITYTKPSGSGIPGTPPVSFSYDQAGNISQMTDGTGQINFDYDTWSRLIRETRFFNEVGGGLTPFPVVYAYNLAGQLKRVVDPFNAQIDYAYDQAGRLSSVTGTPFGNAGVTQYATDMRYRAWGGLKHLNYGNNPLQLNLTYNARLQVETMQVGASPSIPDRINKQYAYFPDGRLKFSRDQVDNYYSRGYEYDFVGRLSQGLSGPSAPQGLSDGPYTQVFGHDRWNNLTSRETGDSRSFSFNYDTATGRNTSWIYDAAGNVTRDERVPVTQFTYDAAGRQITVTGSTSRSWVYDGSGRVAKWVENSEATFDVWSSVLGYVLTEVNASGNKQRTYVYAGRQLLAKQQRNKVFWHHVDASNATSRDSNVNGDVVRTNEIDPLGAPADHTDIPDPDPEIPELLVSFDNLSTGCLLDGIDTPCSMVMRMLQSGAAAIAPLNTTRWNPNTNKFEFFKAYADGTSGWSPIGAPNNGWGYNPHAAQKPPVLGNYNGNPSNKPDWNNDGDSDSDDDDYDGYDENGMIDTSMLIAFLQDPSGRPAPVIKIPKRMVLKNKWQELERLGAEYDACTQRIGTEYQQDFNKTFGEVTPYNFFVKRWGPPTAGGALLGAFGGWESALLGGAVGMWVASEIDKVTLDNMIKFYKNKHETDCEPIRQKYLNVAAEIGYRG